MPKIQNMMSRDFTVVHNTFLRDKKCKYAARGVLMTMLQKPDDYNFTVRGLATETDDGVTAVSTALKLLESLGYIRRTQITEKGRFVDILYQISDEPIFKKDSESDESNTDNSETEKPNTENPYTASSSTANPYDLINTNQLNTDKLNTKEINTPPAANQTAVSVPSKSSSKSKSKKPAKKNYAEAVTMTEEEYQKLTEQHSKAFVDKCIEILNNYKLSSGKPYRSDYHAILNWVVERVSKDYPQLDKTVSVQAPAYDVNVNPFDRFVR